MARNGKTLAALLGLLAAMYPAPSEATEVELTPTIAWRSGGYSCDAPDVFFVPAAAVFPPPPCSLIGAGADDGPAVGAILGVGIGNGFQVEVLLNRQETELSRHPSPIFFFDLIAPLPDADLDVTHLQAGVSKTWDGRTVQPFVGVAAGVSRVDANDPAFLVDFREDAFSASLGAGIKTFIDQRFGVRFEARGYWVDLPRELGGDFTQDELSVGAILRW